MNLSLFEEPEPEIRRTLAMRLAKLAGEGIYFGTSSWKYEGWLGQIYTESRYVTRGRVSQKRFEQECLAEYAEVFPVVCGDFSFYQFPSEAYWRQLFLGAPEPLRFAFKVPEEITVRVFPAHARYGARAGQENPSFLDAGVLDTLFLDPLRPYRARVPVLLFEFGAFSRSIYPEVEPFLSDLDAFLEELPGDFRYGVEIRNAEFLTPEYLELLRGHGVAHVFNAWQRMPELPTQLALDGCVTTDLIVARALLKQGRPYEDAVKMFSPYREIQEPHPPTREGLKALIQEARNRHVPAYLFVNNRLEGNAPQTIAAVTDD